MSFFNSYKELLDNKFPWFPSIVFTKHFDERFKNIETIQHLAEITKQQIVRSQTLIYDDEEYYVARDISSNMIYICFKHFMMLDIDGEDNCKQAIQKLTSFCDINRDYLFYVYKSRNGVHVFCVSHKKDYKNINDIQFMLQHNADFFYTLYVHVRGWCVRLNKKMDEFFNVTPSNGNTVSKFIQSVGCGQPNKELTELLKIYESYMEIYKNAAPSTCP